MIFAGYSDLKFYDFIKFNFEYQYMAQLKKLKYTLPSIFILAIHLLYIKENLYFKMTALFIKFHFITCFS